MHNQSNKGLMATPQRGAHMTATLVQADLDIATRHRIIGRLKQDCGYGTLEAAEVLDGTLDFLRMAAATNGGFAPSEMIDDGWHTFLLYTKEYAAFCEQLGRFVHHSPADNPADNRVITPQMTVDYMIANGIPFNEKLWQIDPNSKRVCSRDCCSGGG